MVNGSRVLPVFNQQPTPIDRLPPGTIVIQIIETAPDSGPTLADHKRLLYIPTADGAYGSFPEPGSIELKAVRRVLRAAMSHIDQIYGPYSP